MVAWRMLRAVLADLHLGQATRDLERFEDLTRELCAREVGELIFLGDLFRTLVGFGRFWGETVRRGLAELAALRQRGVRVILVEGNRDFFLDAPELDPFRDAWGPVHSFAAGGRRFLVEHGDLINRHDHMYRFWRALSKSRPARAWARWLPAGVAQWIVGRTEARLAGTNFTYRRELPAADLLGAARRHFAAGVDVVLWGHFHRSWSFADGGREAHVIDGWMETGTVAWVGTDGSLSFQRPGPDGHFVDTPAHSWYQGRDSAVEAR